MTASVATALGSRGPGVEMEWRGRTVRFRHMQWKSVITELERYLIDRASDLMVAGWARLVAQGLMAREEAVAKSDAFTAECVDRGRYSFGSPVMNAILSMGAAGKAEDDGTIAPEVFNGVLKFLSLMTGLTEDDAVALMGDPEKREEAGLKLSMAMSMGMPPDPKGAGAPGSP
jgi:hypothetical protein